MDEEETGLISSGGHQEVVRRIVVLGPGSIPALITFL